MLEDPSLSYLKLALTDKSEEKLQKLQRDLQADGIQSVFSDPHFLEITPTGITKAHSLVFLADYLGIESENTDWIPSACRSLCSFCSFSSLLSVNANLR